MIDLTSTNDNIREDLASVTSWCQSMYNTHFSEPFESSRKLFDALKNRDRPITDEELTFILLDIPIKLFDVAETLNNFRTSQEVVKLTIKQQEKDMQRLHSEKVEDPAALLSHMQELSDAIIANKLLQSAYSNVISRVENEVSFSKELIMGAKKVWDSRRNGESSNPVNEIDPMLPKYPEFE